MLIPDDLLKNKKVLIGVTGSIAVYKSLELVRLFTKAGADVKIIMSESAKKFVTPLTFETLSSNKVLDDTNESWVNEHNHIKAGDWADLFVIAPITANTIAKLAHGIADNILLQTALAYPKVKLLAPSANTNMIQNPITEHNLKLLRDSNYKFVDTQIKELACKTTGDGAMAEPLEIFWQSARELLKDDFWIGRDAIVSGGGTIEKIDDVRYISNYSSGKMASALSTALYCKGANVTLVTTRFEENIPKSLEKIDVDSSEEMLYSLQKIIETTKNKPKKTYMFMAAAVSDYIPSTQESGKLKKASIGSEWDLKLKENIDILNSIDKEYITTIGFKAEMDAENALENASKMIKNKGIDAVCLNILKNSSSFGTDKNQIDFIYPNKKVESIPSSNKISLSFDILEHAKTLQNK